MPRRATKPPPAFKLGAILGEHEPVLRFGDYFDPKAKLPTPPPEFGHEHLVKDWGALGNTEFGDCAIAGPYHAEMLWNAESGHAFAVDTATALGTYSTLTGFDLDAGPSGANPTDQGADPHDVAEHWQINGIPDNAGTPHRIAAFIDLAPGNLTQLWIATWLFGATGVCLNLPQQWMDASAQDQCALWDCVDDPQFAGGHYVLGVGRRGGNLPVISWGLMPRITPAGYQQCNVRTLAYLSEEMFAKGIDLDGFRFDQLRADITAMQRIAA